MRYTGAVSRGIRLPVISRGDDLVGIISSQLIKASRSPMGPFELGTDIVGVTESSQEPRQLRHPGRYSRMERRCLRATWPLFPILSRNRFGQILKAIVKVGEGPRILHPAGGSSSGAAAVFLRSGM